MLRIPIERRAFVFEAVALAAILALAAWLRLAGIRWVVLDRDSQSRTTTAADDPAPYSRLVRVLQGHGHELAYVVPGASPERWLAQVYRMTDSSGGQQPVPPVAVAGRGDGRLVALTYGACLALAAGIVVMARRRVQS